MADFQFKFDPNTNKIKILPGFLVVGVVALVVGVALTVAFARVDDKEALKNYTDVWMGHHGVIVLASLFCGGLLLLHFLRQLFLLRQTVEAKSEVLILYLKQEISKAVATWNAALKDPRLGSIKSIMEKSLG